MLRLDSLLRREPLLLSRLIPWSTRIEFTIAIVNKCCVYNSGIPHLCVEAVEHPSALGEISIARKFPFGMGDELGPDTERI